MDYKFPICGNAYNNSNKIPYMLDCCGYTLCQECLNKTPSVRKKCPEVDCEIGVPTNIRQNKNLLKKLENKNKDSNNASAPSSNSNIIRIFVQSFNGGTRYPFDVNVNDYTSVLYTKVKEKLKLNQEPVLTLSGKDLDRNRTFAWLQIKSNYVINLLGNYDGGNKK